MLQKSAEIIYKGKPIPVIEHDEVVPIKVPSKREAQLAFATLMTALKGKNAQNVKEAAKVVQNFLETR